MITVRLPAEMHRMAKDAAHELRTSINLFCIKAIEGQLIADGQLKPGELAKQLAADKMHDLTPSATLAHAIANQFKITPPDSDSPKEEQDAPEVAAQAS